MMPRVSIVMPFRDGARWLAEALASLAEQQPFPFELIAVDDGSRDGSAALVVQLWRQLGQPAPLRSIAAGGIGVSGARNLGWRHARASLVAFLDADDLCLPGRLRAQAELLEADPDVDHVVCGWRRFGSGLPEPGVAVRPWEEGAGFGLEAAFRHKAVLPSAWMLRRQVLEALEGFDPALAHAEDVDLLLRLALAGRRGAWLRQILCGYRVHPGGASARLRPQAQALLWVLGQRLRHVPTGHPLAAQGAELLFAARAWAGWKAWSGGDGALALELWRTAWGSSPLGPARTWLHLAQGVESHSRREGVPFTAEQLLADPTWRQLEAHVLAWLEQRGAARHPPGVPMGEAGHRQGWSELVFGSQGEGLRLWRAVLAQELTALAAQAAGDCRPGPLRAWLTAVTPEPDPVAAQRLRALAWLEALLVWPGDDPAPLLQGLGVLLQDWGLLCWGVNGAAAAMRLEQAFALRPQPQGLEGLVLLHAAHAPTGALALGQLASRWPRAPEPSPWPAHAPRVVGSRCEGPSCADCGLDGLLAAGWRRQRLGPGHDWWQAPAVEQAVERCPPTPLLLPGGQAWLRPPLQSPWGTTVAVAVADGGGDPVPELCRSYPQAWPGCRLAPDLVAAPDPEPRPAGEPLQLPGRVLALADLSAEVHYHWLLDQLPRLGLALEALAAEPGGLEGLRLWHNGGADPLRLSALSRWLGLAPDQLIDAREHPWIQAEELLVPGFVSRFGLPSPQAQDWLRQRLLTESQRRARPGRGRRLWLGRAPSARRPVLGEEACLAHLASQGLELEVVRLDRLPLEQQAACLAEADLVVAPHGGALANLVFAAPGTVVLELHQPRYAPPYFHAMVAYLGLALHRCEQPALMPELYRELVFESPLSEPIVLDGPRIAAALKTLPGCP
jgi:GT2 family glycosyltransferase